MATVVEAMTDVAGVAGVANAVITDAEYYRRSEYVEALKSMKKSAYIEIARILQKHNIQTSENRSGIFFDMAKIPQNVFEELVQLRIFIEKNNAELQQRETSLTAARNALVI